MTGFLFIGGAGPSMETLRNVLREPGVICAADSGLDVCAKTALCPDGIVGDMDSLRNRSLLDAYPGAGIERHPRDKDDTDAEIGLNWLRRRGCDRVVMIGGGEGRLDHSLALLSLYDRARPPELWITALEEVCPVEGGLLVEGLPGDGVSFFPVGEGPWEVRSRGLRWELDGVVWKRGVSGLSNRLLANSAEIKVTTGRFLMIRPLPPAGESRTRPLR